MTRDEQLSYYRTNPDVSVLIIGAGINGIGTFRDLALQGVDVLLIDRGDFCSGTSAASSHMVHGGIRYLENGEFRLVREAVQERNRLIQNAPHAVKPLATVIPIFKRFSGLLNAPLKFLRLLNRPAERGSLIIKLGLMMYDAYTRAQGTVPGHRLFDRQESLARYPKLNPAIVHTATYFDAAMPSPERICIELVLDGEAASPQAQALNYVSAIGAAGDTLTLRDELSGQTLTIKPKVVVNAAGPWIDFANRALGRETRFIGGTKGSHLVLEHPELRQAIGQEEFFFENQDGRIVLIYPLLDKVLVGASDIHIDNPDEARCTEEEIDYFIELIARVFPSIEVDKSHVVFSFSGVRPLPASDATTTGQISRDHSIRTLQAENGLAFPIHSLIGGKWTTYRAFSEQTADLLLNQLGLPRQQSTADLPIGGGRDYPGSETAKEQWLARLQTETGLSLNRLDVLFQRYGTRAEEVAAFITESDDMPLSHHPGYSRREALFLAQQEKVILLDDLILRRTLIGMLGETTPDLLKELAQVIAEALGWTDEQQQAEVDRTLALLADRHGVELRTN